MRISDWSSDVCGPALLLTSIIVALCAFRISKNWRTSGCACWGTGILPRQYFPRWPSKQRAMSAPERFGRLAELPHPAETLVIEFTAALPDVHRSRYDGCSRATGTAHRNPGWRMCAELGRAACAAAVRLDRKSTRLNSSH